MRSNYQLDYSLMKTTGVDILAIGVHPDDIELACSGTLIKHVQMGKSVGMLDLTAGELGTRGSAELRLKEAETAREIVGAQFRDNLGYADGFFQNDKTHQLGVVRKIRQYRPDIVLINAISDRHPDHGRAAQLVKEACFYSGLIKVETAWEGVPQERWRPKAVYHYIQDHYIRPDFIVDVSAQGEQKMQAIQAFSSQFYRPDAQEPASPISSLDFLAFVQARMRDFGRVINATYGEGFVAARTPAVNDLTQLG
jgi:bacillithiol biosynthesis deacetylase BshB1